MNRYLPILSVFDTYSGLPGEIVSLELAGTAVPPLAPLFVGPYLAVYLQDGSTQTFTAQGNRIDHSTGIPTLGCTLLTQIEYSTLLGAGYPTTR